MEITKEEARAIRTLERLAKRWPKSLWLFSAGGAFHVMKLDPEGNRYVYAMGHESGGSGMDHAASLATIAIPSDGGDW